METSRIVRVTGKFGLRGEKCIGFGQIDQKNCSDYAIIRITWIRIMRSLLFFKCDYSILLQIVYVPYQLYDCIIVWLYDYSCILSVFVWLYYIVTNSSYTCHINCIIVWFYNSMIVLYWVLIFVWMYDCMIVEFLYLYDCIILLQIVRIRAISAALTRRHKSVLYHRNKVWTHVCKLSYCELLQKLRHSEVI